MKNTTSLLSLLLSFGGLLTACNANYTLNCNDDEIAFQGASKHNGIDVMQRIWHRSNIEPDASCEKHNTALIEAVTGNNVEAVKFLLETVRVDPNKLETYDKTEENLNYTPLHWATFRGNAPIVKLLLDWGAEVDSRDNMGRTPLHEASKNGHTVIAGLLLDKGADVNSQTNSGNSSLHRAAQNGRIEMVKLLLSRGAQADIGNSIGTTPLIFAASRGCLNIAQILLDNWAQINEKDCEGRTALHCATFNNKPQIARLLLSRGADLDLENNEGKKPFDPSFSKLSPEETLLLAAVAGHRGIVKEFLDKGVDINTQDRHDKDTALIRAVRNGHITLVRDLVEGGADINLRNEEKKSAIMVAVEEGQETIALALIKIGTYLNFKDNRGWSALKYSRNGKSKNKDIAKVLLQYGAEEYLLRKKVMKHLPGAAQRTVEIAPQIAPLLL